MKLVARFKNGDEGIIVGYGPGKKGRPLAMILIDGKIRATKLRAFEIVGYARLKAYGEIENIFTQDLRDWNIEGVTPS